MRRGIGSEQLVGRVRQHEDAVEKPQLRGEPEPLLPAARTVAPGVALRGTPVAASAINLLAGIWLVIAPWVLGYTSVASEWNAVACGCAIALLALARLTGAARLLWASWINCLIGIWLVVATFTIDVNATEWINDVIVGGVVALLALWSATSGADAAEGPGTLEGPAAEEIIAPEPYPRRSARPARRPGSLPH
jgi:hypothetical protein